MRRNALHSMKGTIHLKNFMWAGSCLRSVEERGWLVRVKHNRLGLLEPVLYV